MEGYKNEDKLENEEYSFDSSPSSDSVLPTPYSLSQIPLDKQTVLARPYNVMNHRS
ncbi:MAG: hypothetical protein HC908_07720 [Calothrix sp. SM1_7_51]|nr:hypothetical protein [Calothrix sp. SM1_7_51]